MFRHARAQLDKGRPMPSPRNAPTRAAAGTAVLPVSGPAVSPAAPVETPIGASSFVSDLDSPMRRAALYFGLIFIFVRFSLLNEILTEVLGINTYVLLLFATLSLIGVVISGGIQRTLALWPTRLWIAFGLWLLFSVPFSTWRGD